MTTLLVLMSGVVIIGSFLDIDFTLTLHRNNLYDIIILILWGYFSLESGLFLMFEGKCSYDDEEESEEE